jgi:phage anti-repressor protein
MSDYKIHTIIFNKNKNTFDDVVNFLKRHKYKIKKLDIAENGDFIRARQLSPEYLKRIGYDNYRTITLDDKKDIKMIIGYNRNRDLMPKIIEGGLLLRKSKYI